MRLGTAGVFLSVSLFVVLPLYELADIGEHWPHDGTYVSAMLTALFFMGLTLILRNLAAIASRSTVAFQARQSGHLGGVARAVAATQTAKHAGHESAGTRGDSSRLKRSRNQASILDGARCARLLILGDFRI